VDREHEATGTRVQAEGVFLRGFLKVTHLQTPTTILMSVK
jgi:hypothetical protein